MKLLINNLIRSEGVGGWGGVWLGGVLHNIISELVVDLIAIGGDISILENPSTKTTTVEITEISASEEIAQTEKNFTS
jgi:hypothetical protein